MPAVQPAADQLAPALPDTDPVTTPGQARGRTAQAAWSAEVLRALDRLDELDRTALRLIYFDDLTQAQVAHRLAQPETTIRAHVARGMQALAHHLTTGRTTSTDRTSTRRQVRGG